MPTTTLAAAAADLRAVLARGGAPAAQALNALLARLASDPAVDVVSEGPSGLDALEGTLFALRHRGLERLIGDELDLDAVVAVGRRLVERLAAFPRHPALERAGWAWLDLARRAPIPRLVAERGQSDAFFALELSLIEASRFTLGRLFAQRVETYGTRTLFRVPSRGPAGQYSWLDVASRASLVARGLLALFDSRGAGPVALVSENRYELALIDLACLAHGVVTAMIPPDTTPDDLLDILAASEVAICVVSNASHLVRLDFSRAPTVHTVVVIDRPPTRAHGVMTLAEVERQGAGVPEARLAAQTADLDADAMATVMYTSGTSGRPKGIRFTHRCLVSKRFARGLALPTVDEGGVFLAYLPLYHTFGRYLEMLGSVFWGATYVFAEDTSVDALVDAFRAFRPTVFISIPLKWVQLHEHIGQLVDLATAPDDEIARAVRAVVGERLNVGLSAAGYLDPSVFRFFQRYGVDLNSGFGMTEGTGGLLMTPPGRYREDSLGVPLPGTEARLADDGELLVRGAYVTPGYMDPEHDAAAWTADRWLKTGDVMEQDADGFFRIVDRKKDIFKNVKGETIAPQRVERLFSEIEAVKRFVLIGDHRPFNTGLIVPNLDVSRPDLRAMDPEELHEYFRPHVVTANRFLAPFERVVDFAVLPRDFDAERGELTPKGTLRRRNIESAFSSEIEALYHRGQRLAVAGVDVALRLPSWVFQSLGVTVSGVQAAAGGLRVGATGRVLEVSDRGRGPGGRRQLRIGSSVYAVDGDVLDLGVVLQTPALWLGNEALLGFVSVGTRRRMRRGLPPRGVALVGREAAHTPSQDERSALALALGEAQPGLAELETGASLVGADDEAVAVGAVTLIARVLACQPGQLGTLALTVLRAAASLPGLEVRRAALRVLLQAERGERAAATLARFSPGLETLLDGPTRATMATEMLSDDALEAVTALARARAEAAEGDAASARAEAEAVALIALLADYGAAHPARYRQARRGLAAIEAFAPTTEVKAAARGARTRMTERFRAWIGPTAALAVDPETGQEYGWAEVVAFDEEIEPEVRAQLLDGLRCTTLVQETLFQLYDGASVRLSDIPPGGVWISQRWREPWRSVYRATVHTRFRGHYDLAIKLDHEARGADADDEQVWLLVVGDRADRAVAARQGGRWPERGLWTEQFQGTRRANWQIERLHRRGKLAEAWPAICWGVGKVCCDVWDAMGRRFVPADLSPANFAIPGEDYKTGSRLASAARRLPYRGVAALLDDFQRGFVAPVQAAYPEVRGDTPWEAVLTGLVEVVGVADGLALLATVADTTGDAALALAAREFATQVERNGLVPRQLLHAIDRYRAWEALAGEATAEARATMVQELCRTYQLGALRHAYPEARTRLFRATVLANVPDWVGRQLDVMIDELRTGAIAGEALTERVGLLRGAPGAEPELEYFLARLGYPHLEPGDDATLLSGESHGLGAELVVALEDSDGRPFQVRPPVNPKELAALHRLYVGADIQVAFQAHHRFMLAVDERGGVLGGMYYALDLETRVCHLEKVVVTEARRGRGVGDGLMVELFKRLTSAGYSAVTTGFYRRGYFYRLGFQVEGRHPGLVKHLDG